LDYTDAMHALIGPRHGYPVVLIYVLVVRTALLQLPRPWLLLHAAVQWVLVVLLCHVTPGICGENWLRVPLWLQGAVCTAGGVGVVLLVAPRTRARSVALGSGSSSGSSTTTEKRRV
jgi:hypothetical protein